MNCVIFFVLLHFIKAVLRAIIISTTITIFLPRKLNHNSDEA
jgi:hypothetical protein